MLPVSSNDYWTLDLERLGMQAAGEGLARQEKLGARPGQLRRLKPEHPRHLDLQPR